jgi:hypothetical protein
MVHLFAKSRALTLLSLLVASSATVVISAQQADAPPVRPNFSGRWRMVKEKSQFNGFKVPDVVNLHTIQTTGKQTSMSDVSYFTDNSVTMNNIKGRDAQSRAYWDGPALIVRTKMVMASGEHEVIEDRWELSEDGKTLTTASHIMTESGEANLTLVCEKEEQKKGS